MQGREWNKLVFRVPSKPGHSVKSSNAYVYTIGSTGNASFSRFFCKYFFTSCPAFMKPCFYLQASSLKKIHCQYNNFSNLSRFFLYIFLILLFCPLPQCTVEYLSIFPGQTEQAWSGKLDN